MRVGFDGKRAANNRVGLGNYSRTLLHDLARIAPDNHYLVYSPVAFQGDLCGELLTDKAVSLISPNARTPWGRHFWRYRSVSRLALQDRLDVFHGLSHTLPRGLPCPSVVTMHDLIVLRRPHDYAWIDRVRWRASFREAAKRASIVLAVSEATRQDLIELLDVLPDKIVVTGQSCRPGCRRAPRDPKILEDVRKRYELPARFVLSVGTVEPRKNAVRLVRAFRKALDGKEDGIQLALIGKQTRYTKEVLLESERSDGRVRLLGYVRDEDLPAMYALADLFAYVPLIEGFGLPVLEAIHCGTPVVTSSCSSLPEVAGEAGLLVDPEDEDSIAQGLIDGLFSASTRSRLAAEAASQIGRFSPEAVVRRVLKAYERASGNSG